MMYSKKKQGFSLAELLISLLIISIVLAAAIPTITKRNAAGGEKIWHWTNTNNGAYFGVGSNQSAIIGADQIPFIEDLNDTSDSFKYIKNFFQDTDVFGNSTALDNTALTSIASHFTTTGDKLVLLKKAPTKNEGGTTMGLSNLVNSHISLYTVEASSDPAAATTKDIRYAGRLAADRHNLALGIGSLQSTNTTLPGFNGYNTALGHHSLVYNISGEKNTAVGERTITLNRSGQDNTALGYGALSRMEAGSVAADYKTVSGNTAIGSLALSTNALGQSNTAVGHLALTGGTEGSYNTALGNSACSHIKGNYNLCLGYGSGSKAPTEAEQDYYLAIGSVRDENDTALDETYYSQDDDTPIITGIMQAYNDGTETVDKYLGINTRIFSVNTFNGSKPVFYARSKMGDTNYEKGKATIGDFFFNLRDTGDPSTNTTSDKTSVILSLSGTSDTSGTNKKVIINAHDTYHPDDNDSFADFNINHRFTMGFENNGIISFSSEHLDKHGNTQFNTFSFDNFVKIASYTTGNSSKPNQAFMLARGTNDDDYAMYYDRNDDKMTFSTNRMGIDVEDDYIVYGTSVSLYADGEGTTQGSGSDANGSAYIGAKKHVYIAPETGQVRITGDVIVNKGNMYDSSAVNHVRIDDGEIYLNKDGKTYGVHSMIKQLEADVERLKSQISYSDARLKNIFGDNKAGLKEINALEVKNFTYKNDKEKTPHVGVIAQQLQKVFPNSVTKDEKGYLMIRTEEIFYAMVNSIKELFAMFQDITAKVTGLDKRITELEQQNQLLKQQNEAFEKRLSKLEKQTAK